MSQYHPLTPAEVIELVRDIPDFFSSSAELDCQEIGDGNLNLVFHIQDTSSGKSIIVKQALPYAKVVGESWPLSLDRARIERQALQEQHRLCPGLVPEVYDYNDELALTIMEDLSGYTIMRKALIEGQRFPEFAGHIGQFMARTLFLNSDLALGPIEKKNKVSSFINPDQCKITEDLIFDDPYRLSDNNSYSPSIEDEAEALRTDGQLHLEVALLREKFLTHAESLLHGDLHTGSIFVTDKSTKVIDPEFAYYGPMGFDVGAVISNLLLNLAGQIGWIEDTSARLEQQRWLLDTSMAVWAQFEQEFRKLWSSEALKDPLAASPGYQEFYITRLLQDSFGFAGCKMIRRIVGLSHVVDIDTIADPVLKERAERLALAIGKALVKRSRSVQSIEELKDIVLTAAAAKGESL